MAALLACRLAPGLPRVARHHQAASELNSCPRPDTHPLYEAGVRAKSTSLGVASTLTHIQIRCNMLASPSFAP